MRIITRPIVRWPGQLLNPGQRANPPFTAGWTETMELLTKEARNLGAPEIVIQLALDESDIRLDGWPYAAAKTAHPGVIVSVESKTQGPLSFPCDRFDGPQWRSRVHGWQANVRAVALAMEALRKVDRYGITRHGEQYVGWKAIGTGSPIAAGSGEEPMDAEQAARILLEAAGMATGADYIAEMIAGDTGLIRTVVRKAMADTHPDRHGGDDQAFKLVERAKRVLENTA